MVKVTIISGAPNTGSRLNGLTQWIETSLNSKGVSVETTFVHALPANDLLGLHFESEAIVEANRRVETADGIIIATPVYKGTYAGILKTYLDLLPQKALEGKIVLPIAIGGTYGHLLSLEYGLKPLLALLGSTHYGKSVYALDTAIERNENGGFALDFELLDRLEKATTSFIYEIQTKRGIIDVQN
ncbi:MAG: NADPH-dependent FMN reductase [Bacilli bacterium]